MPKVRFNLSDAFHPFLFEVLVSEAHDPISDSYPPEAIERALLEVIGVDLESSAGVQCIFGQLEVLIEHLEHQVALAAADLAFTGLDGAAWDVC